MSLSTVKIKIIILNYKSYLDTIKYVKNLNQQRNVELDILIVDNDSPNESYKILKDKYFSVDNVSVIKNSCNSGYASGNNFGIKHSLHSSEDLIVISNNDLILDDQYLLFNWANQHFNLENVAISSPKMLLNGKPAANQAWKIPSYKDSLFSSIATIEKIFGDRKLYDFNDSNDTIRVDCLPGCLFMIKYSDFERIDFFDEGTFLYMEEVILSRKIKDLGKKNYLIRSLTYNHLHSKTISQNLSLIRMRRYLVESTCYYHKNYDNIGTFKLFLLKFNHYIWSLEFSLISLFKK